MDQDSSGSGTVAHTILLVANVLTSVNITSLTVPELVVSQSPVTLDCQVSAEDERFTLQWLVAGEPAPLYEWSPYSEPVVRGLLQGRLDLDFRVSDEPLQSRRALRIAAPTPDLSGDYTCRVTNGERQHNRTASMLVYSPEQEFSFEAVKSSNGSGVVVRCGVRGVFPQPVLVLEQNHSAIPQVSRVWVSGDGTYSAQASAGAGGGGGRGGGTRCRLHIPQAGYEAVRDLPTDKSLGSKNSTSNVCYFYIVILSLTLNIT